MPLRVVRALHPLRRERSNDHADERREQAGELPGKILAEHRHLREEEDPRPDAEHDRRDGTLRRRPLPVEPHGQRDERADERDLVGRRHQLVDRRTLHRHRVREHEPREHDDRQARREEALAVAHVRPEVAQDVLHEARRRREQRRRRRALDGRQQRAEEEDLHHERHLRQHEGGQQALVVVLGDVERLLAHHDDGGGDDEHGHEREQDVAAAPDHGTVARRLLVLRGHHALEDVLLRDAAEHHRGRGRDEERDVAELRLGQDLPEVRLRRERQHVVGAAREVGCVDPDHGEPHDEHDHLDEVGPGDREEAADHDVDQDGERADDHPGVLRHRAAGEHREHESQRRDLRRDPAEVAEDDGRRAEHLHALAVAVAEEVADGQEVLAVEAGREEQAHEDEAHARAERVLDDGTEAALHEPRGDPHDGLGAEPGGERRRDHHREREAAAGEREVGCVLDPRAGPHAEGEGAHEVEHDEDDQRGVHAWMVGFMERAEV